MVTDLGRHHRAGLEPELQILCMFYPIFSPHRPGGRRSRYPRIEEETRGRGAHLMCAQPESTGPPSSRQQGHSPAPSSDSADQRSLWPVWPGGSSGPAARSCIHPETGQARQATPHQARIPRPLSRLGDHSLILSLPQRQRSLRCSEPCSASVQLRGSSEKEGDPGGGFCGQQD